MFTEIGGNSMIKKYVQLTPGTYLLLRHIFYFIKIVITKYSRFVLFVMCTALLEFNSFYFLQFTSVYMYVSSFVGLAVVLYTIYLITME